MASHLVPSKKRARLGCGLASRQKRGEVKPYCCIAIGGHGRQKCLYLVQVNRLTSGTTGTDGPAGFTPILRLHLTDYSGQVDSCFCVSFVQVCVVYFV